MPLWANSRPTRQGAGLFEQFGDGGWGAELAGLDEESSSESFEVIKGWPDTCPPGGEWVLGFTGAPCVLPQSG